MSDVDRSNLPIRRPSFSGVAGKTLAESQPDWNLIGHPTPPEGSPNVLLVLIDDAGFGNPSTFGGPIQTPNYTRIAHGGLRYNRFHVTALCSPTRASLLTGRNNHAVGFGSIGEFAGGFPGYSANTSARLRAAPSDSQGQRLQHRRSSESGTSHPMANRVPPAPSTVGRTAGASITSTGSSGEGRASGTPAWPRTRRSSARLTKYYDDERPLLLSRRDGGSDASSGYTESAPRTLTSPSSSTSRPAAATPLTTSPRRGPTSTRGSSTKGGTGLREETFARQKELGVIPADAELTPRDKAFPAWDGVPDNLKAFYARQMEVYAGYSENADYNVGRVIDAIEDLGELDDTLILWIWGDNGASMEGTITGSFNELTMQNGIPLTDEMQLQLSELYGGLDQWGAPIMDPHYSAGGRGPGPRPFSGASRWARTSAGPAIRWSCTGLVASRMRARLRSQFTHVIDVAPTILDVAGIPEPDTVDGNQQEPMHGTSFTASFTDGAAPEHRTQQYFETIGNRGMYKDGWWLAMKTERIPWELSPEALGSVRAGRLGPRRGPG